ncbi:MAG TPA: hypothetical protein VK178_06020 [Opitutaceae bacterium]|nr:hypothetical protein [Opitutaceae bacterium]
MAAVEQTITPAAIVADPPAHDTGVLRWFWQPALASMGRPPIRSFASTDLGALETLPTDSAICVFGDALFHLPGDRLRTHRIFWFAEDLAAMGRVTETHVVQLARIFSPFFPDEWAQVSTLDPTALGAAFAKTVFIPSPPQDPSCSPDSVRPPAVRFFTLQELRDAVVWFAQPNQPGRAIDAAAAMAAMLQQDAPHGIWILHAPAGGWSPSASRQLWTAACGGVPVISASLRDGCRQAIALQRIPTHPSANSRHDSLAGTVSLGRHPLRTTVSVGDFPISGFIVDKHDAAKLLRSSPEREGGALFADGELTPWLAWTAAMIDAHLESVFPPPERERALARCRRLLPAPDAASGRTTGSLTSYLASWGGRPFDATAVARFLERASLCPEEVALLRQHLLERSPHAPWQTVIDALWRLPMRELYLDQSPRTLQLVHASLELLKPPTPEGGREVELIRLWCLAVARDCAAFSANVARWASLHGARHVLSAIDYAFAADLQWDFPQVDVAAAPTGALPGGVLLAAAAAYSSRASWAITDTCLQRLHEEHPNFFLNAGDIHPWNKHVLLARLLHQQGCESEAAAALDWARATDLGCADQERILARTPCPSAVGAYRLPRFAAPWSTATNPPCPTPPQ